MGDDSCECCKKCGGDPCQCYDNRYVTGGGAAQVIGSVIAGVMFYPIIILCILMIIIAMFFIMAGSYVKGITLGVMGAGSIAGILFFIEKV